MNKASLNQNIRPKSSYGLDHLWVAIYGETVRLQTSCYQRSKELNQLILRILGNAVLTGRYRMSLGIHQGNKAAGTIQERSVQNEVMALLQIQGRAWRRLLQLAVDHAIELPLAIAALICQLPGRITLNNPELKPFLLFSLGGLTAHVSSTAGTLTTIAKPTLFSLVVMTVSPENTRAQRAKFFYA